MKNIFIKRSILMLPLIFSILQYGLCQNLYDLQDIQLIEITFNQSNWDYMMDTAKQGAEGYITAQSVSINGVIFDSVGVKYKGNSSYSPNKIKNPLHIELDYIKNEQAYDGYTDIKLGNGFKDPSFIREVLSYKILRNYMAAPLSNYANLYINGQHIGFYTNTESITKKFVSKHFYSNENAFFKCNPEYSSSGKSNLVYLGGDSSLYFNSYEMKSDYGWNEMVMLCNTLKNIPGAVNDIVDIDRVLWMFAYCNITVNLDSYLGGITQNYYLYRSDNGSFNPVVWDLNEAFGCFNNTGEGPPLGMTQMQQMSPWLHLNNASWPLIQKLLNNNRYKKMYIAHMRTMFDEFFGNDLYVSMADSIMTMIDSDVQADINKMYTYTQFLNSLTTSITQGMMIPGISLLMNGRKTYLSGLTEFQYQQPVIGTPVVSDNAPKLGDTVFVTSSIQNADSIYIGYRHSLSDRFARVRMYDDGMHQDGAAQDGVYGASVIIASPATHYYIYAENSTSGCFSPVRAEYEFYNIETDMNYISQGTLVINEILAINSSTNMDIYNEYSDWVELYNNSADTLDMSYLYVSDNYNIPLKWQFPAQTVMPPHTYLLVWANDNTTGNGMNMPYKLSGSGERIILSYAGGYIVDSTSFGQQTEDISFGRYPNGTGSFVIMPPTPLAINIISSISENNGKSQISIYPNPSGDYIVVDPKAIEITSTELYSMDGKQIYSDRETYNSPRTLSTYKLKEGMYILKLNGHYTFRCAKLGR